MSTSLPSVAGLVPHLRNLLTRHGLRPAIVFLNGLTAFRYTAVFRFDDEISKTVCFFDREDLKADVLPEMPIVTSYCVYVRDLRSAFSLPDSMTEVLVAAHPMRDRIHAYCGAPLLDAEGDVVGSICHFNVTALPLAESDAQLLEAAAELIMARGFVDPPRANPAR